MFNAIVFHIQYNEINSLLLIQKTGQILSESD